MRYFCNPDLGLAMKDILTEAFNLEVGKEVAINGDLKADFSKAPAYPSFMVDNVRSSIKTNLGVIFLPRIMIHDFVKSFIHGLHSLSVKYKDCTEIDHLQSYSAIETGNDHFLVMKARHNINDNNYSSNNLNNSSKRAIYVNAKDEKIERIIGNARFTWLIYDLNQLMNNIAYYDSCRVPLECQLVSILYDPHKYVNLPNGHLLVSNLTFKYFDNCRNFIQVCSFGKIGKALFEKHENSENYKILTFIDYLQKNMKYPEFMPGWADHQYLLQICEKRGGAFEIIRHLGDANIYILNQFPIFTISSPIYEVDFEEISIDNSTLNVDNDRCGKCRTPLYDWIYIVCEKKNNFGRAYCAVCLHSKFDETSGICNYNTGTSLFTSSDVIAKTIYPRTVENVINMLNTDQIVKDILAQSFQPKFVDSTGLLEVMYLNFNSAVNTNNIDTNFQKYIGCNGSPSQYIDYLNSNFNDIFAKFSDRESCLKYIASCKIFRYTTINFK